MRRVSILFFALSLCAAAALPAANSSLIVSTDWLARNLNRPDLTIIEIGDRAAFERGHIPGARFVALSDIVVDRAGIPNELPEVAALERTFRAAGVNDKDRIVLYAHDVVHAARAFFTLDYLGCGERTSILDGGSAKWNAEKRPLQVGGPLLEESRFVAHPKPEVLAGIEQVRTACEKSQSAWADLALVDARSWEQYAGTESGPGIARPGHIPGALSVPWDFNLTADAIAVFRDADTLHTLYRGCGVSTNASVIAYCRSGMQASVTYFVLRYLGADVKLYDGSYAEWSTATPASKSAL